jgi:hypothetical protein
VYSCEAWEVDTVAIIQAETDLHKYFSMFTQETTAGRILKIDKIFPRPKITIGDIETAAATGASHILIGAHGIPRAGDAIGVQVSLGGDFITEKRLVPSLVNDRPQQAQDAAVIAESRVGSDIGNISVNELDQLRNIRAKKLQRIDFRACALGQSRTFLQKLKKLFGCTGTICAPDLFIAVSEKQFKPLPFDAKEKIQAPDWQVEGNPPNRFAYRLNLTKKGIFVRAESWQAVDSWRANHFLPAKVLPKTAFEFMGLIDGQTLQKLFFPKDPEYAAHLVSE